MNRRLVLFVNHRFVLFVNRRLVLFVNRRLVLFVKSQVCFVCESHVCFVLRRDGGGTYADEKNRKLTGRVLSNTLTLQSFVQTFAKKKKKKKEVTP